MRIWPQLFQSSALERPKCSNYLNAQGHAGNDIALSHSAVSYPRT